MYEVVIIWVHFNTILASYSFLILFNIRWFFGLVNMPFSLEHFILQFFSIAPVKCIAAMNFIYSLLLAHSLALDPIAVLKIYDAKIFSKIWTFFAFCCWYLFSCFQQFSCSQLSRGYQKWLSHHLNFSLQSQWDNGKSFLSKNAI